MKAAFSRPDRAKRHPFAFSARSVSLLRRVGGICLFLLTSTSLGNAATAPPGAPFEEVSMSTSTSASRMNDDALVAPGASADAIGLLFDSGTPLTNPFSICGGCYAWSSTYYESPANFDFTARKFTVPTGSFASAIRIWFAYGDDGPLPNNANLGGAPGDFSSISFDLYAPDGPAGSPGTLLANLTGTWSVLDAPTNHRELTLDDPYVFSGTDYYACLRAETALGDYQATLLWAMCAPSDPHIDYANYDTVHGTTGGWVGYPSQPPCPADQNFGLQIVGAIAPDEIEIVAGPGCLTPAESCKTLAFDFNRADTTPLRGFSVTFHLSGLELCAGIGSIDEGSYLSGYCGGSCTVMQVIDNGSGSYTVDAAILGANCGPGGSGTLFTVDVKSSGPDGIGSASVTSVLARDCLNAPIPAAPGAGVSFTIDSFGPAPVADLTATPVLFGNDFDGTTAATLTFSAPGDAEVVEVYRAPFGDHPTVTNAYPEYDDVAGAAPPALPDYPPAAPWSLTSVTASGQTDDPGARGYWYYAVFTKDECGNVSLVSNITAGLLDYHLGDVSDGGAGLGDNAVGIPDMSALGAHYGISLAHNDPYNYLDVGPTHDGSVLGRPTTDNEVGFEDLILFAINYGEVSAVRPSTAPVLAQAQLRMDVETVGEQTIATLRLVGNAVRVQGVHARIGGDDALRLVSHDLDGLWAQQSAPAFVKVYERDGDVIVDGVVLGSGQSIEGNGIVARLVLESVPRLDLIDVSLRDAANREVGPGAARWNLGEVEDSDSRDSGTSDRSRAGADVTAAFDSDLVETATLSIAPNPFVAGTKIVYHAPAATRVEAAIFDVSGQRVCTWPPLHLAAGDHVWSWDGRADHGGEVAAGVYLLRLETADGSIVRKMFRIRS